MTKYQVTIETKFDTDAKCGECEFRYETQDRLTSNDVICRLTKRYLIGFQSDEMCFGGGYRKKFYEGERPEWCPLQKVEVPS